MDCDETHFLRIDISLGSICSSLTDAQVIGGGAELSDVFCLRNICFSYCKMPLVSAELHRIMWNEGLLLICKALVGLHKSAVFHDTAADASSPTVVQQLHDRQ